MSTGLLLVACSGNKDPKPGPDEEGAPSASRTIGSAGGEVALGSARLVIPPGALPQDTVLRLSETQEPAPTGSIAFSKIYRFEPAGTHFAVPIQIELPFSGDASLATFFLSKENAPGFDALSTQVTGNVASAEVSHFSMGFIGAAPGVWNQSQWNGSIWQ